MTSFNHDQQVFSEAEQIDDLVNNAAAEIPDLIEVPEDEDIGCCPCNCIIEAISVLGGCLLTACAGYWAWDEEFGNPLMELFHQFPNM